MFKKKKKRHKLHFGRSSEFLLSSAHFCGRHFMQLFSGCSGCYPLRRLQKEVEKNLCAYSKTSKHRTEISVKGAFLADHKD